MSNKERLYQKFHQLLNTPELTYAECQKLRTVLCLLMGHSLSEELELQGLTKLSLQSPFLVNHLLSEQASSAVLMGRTPKYLSFCHAEFNAFKYLKRSDLN